MKLIRTLYILMAFYSITACTNIKYVDSSDQASDEIKLTYETTKIASAERIIFYGWLQNPTVLQFSQEDKSYLYNPENKEYEIINDEELKFTYDCEHTLIHPSIAQSCGHMESGDVPPEASLVSAQDDAEEIVYLIYVPDPNAPTPEPASEGYPDDRTMPPLDDYYQVWLVISGGIPVMIDVIPACDYGIRWGDKGSIFVIARENVFFDCGNYAAYIGTNQSKTLTPIIPHEIYTSVSNAIDFSPNGKNLLFVSEDWSQKPFSRRTLILELASGDVIETAISSTSAPINWISDQHILIKSKDIEYDGWFLAIHDIKNQETTFLNGKFRLNGYCFSSPQSRPLTKDRKYLAYYGSSIDCLPRTGLEEYWMEDLWLIEFKVDE